MTTGTLSQTQAVICRTSTRRVAYFTAKRTIDVCVALVLLVVVSPLLLVACVLVVIDSGRPLFFRQDRIRGRRDGHGSWVLESFTLFKLRTMVVDADSSLHQAYMTAYIRGDQHGLRALRPDRRDGESFRPGRDPRLTRVGQVLRRLSIDELPQLWNVIRGDMSLVGPRPPMPYEVDLYSDRDLLRLTTPQGITGWAQIKGRSAVAFPELIGRDLEYLEHQSIVFDLKVMLLTVPAVLSRRGAD